MFYWAGTHTYPSYWILSSWHSSHLTHTAASQKHQRECFQFYPPYIITCFTGSAFSVVAYNTNKHGLTVWKDATAFWLDYLLLQLFRRATIPGRPCLSFQVGGFTISFQLTFHLEKVANMYCKANWSQWTRWEAKTQKLPINKAETRTCNCCSSSRFLWPLHISLT